MAKGSNQKLKLYYLLKFLQEKTDEEHAVTMPEILAYLQEHDISAERKSIYADFHDLEKLGYEVVGEKAGASYEYRLLTREFELTELKLLVDLIQTSKFLTLKKSQELISKLESQCSEYDAKKLQRQVYVQDRVKADNESIYYSVDAIQSAIAQNHMISFQYFQWNTGQRGLAVDLIAATDSVRQFRTVIYLLNGTRKSPSAVRERIMQFSAPLYKIKDLRPDPFIIVGAAGTYLPEAVPVDVHPPQTHSGLPRPERGTVVDFPCADRHHPDRLYHAVNPVITFHCFSLLFTPSYKTRSNRHLRILYYQFTGLRRTFKPCPRFEPEQDKKIPRQAKLPDRRLLRFTSGSAPAE